MRAQVMMYTLSVSKGNGIAKFESSKQRIIFYDLDGTAKSIDLSATESKTLELLIKSAGNVVSRDEILKYAWPSRVVSSGSINQCIFSLRNLIGDERNHEIIQTVTRKGYKLNPAALIQESSQTHQADCTRPMIEVNTSLTEVASINNSNVDLPPITEPIAIHPASLTKSWFISLNKKKILLLAAAFLFFPLVLYGFQGKIIHYVEAYTTQYKTAAQHHIGNSRVVLFGLALESPVLSEVLPELRLTNARPVTIIIHRWRNTFTAACVNSNYRAFNTRINFSGDSATKLYDFVEHCRWQS